jgi:ATP-dependent Clp protease ATP-binding subunit ClpA
MAESSLSDRRFTDSAQRVMSHVTERAFDRGMLSGELSEATAGMLAVLSMVRWERKVGKAALERMGITLDSFAKELDEAIDEEGRATRSPTGPKIEVLPSGQQAHVIDTRSPLRLLLEQAEQQALALGNNWVGTEHLLLAAVHLACPRFRNLLGKYAIGYETVKQSVIEVLRG